MPLDKDSSYCPSVVNITVNFNGIFHCLVWLHSKQAVSSLAIVKLCVVHCSGVINPENDDDTEFTQFSWQFLYQTVLP